MGGSVTSAMPIHLAKVASLVFRPSRHWACVHWVLAFVFRNQKKNGQICRGYLRQWGHSKSSQKPCKTSKKENNGRWAVLISPEADLGMWERLVLAGFAPVLPGFVATVACSPVKTNDHD